MLRYRYTLDLFQKSPKTFQIQEVSRAGYLSSFQISSGDHPNRWFGTGHEVDFPENRHHHAESSPMSWSFLRVWINFFTTIPYFLKIKIHFPGNWIVVPGTHSHKFWVGWPGERWLPISVLKSSFLAVTLQFLMVYQITFFWLWTFLTVNFHFLLVKSTLWMGKFYFLVVISFFWWVNSKL